MRREFDVVMAWSVDRLGQSLQDLVSFLGELRAKEVDLYLHQQGVDTTTPAGEALFQMLGVFAQFERALIRGRVHAGLARAVAQGSASVSLGLRPTRYEIHLKRKLERMTPDCVSARSRTHRPAHPKSPDQEEWLRSRSMLDCATVLVAGRSPGKSRLAWLSKKWLGRSGVILRQLVTPVGPLVGGTMLLAACTTTTRFPQIDSELTAVEAAKQREIAVMEQSRLKDRLNRVATPMLVANVELCGDRTAPSFGFDWAVRFRIPADFRDTYTSLFGVTDQPTVIRVRDDGPAAAAGFVPGDIIKAIDGEKALTGQGADRWLSEKLSAAKQEMVFLVDRGGELVELPARPIELCGYQLKLELGSDVNAFADGKRIVVTSGMMSFANDLELALIVGHEMAHNAMGHIEAKRTNSAIGALVGGVLTVAHPVPWTQVCLTRRA